jgi:hypothetical protein
MEGGSGMGEFITSAWEEAMMGELVKVRKVNLSTILPYLIQQLMTDYRLDISDSKCQTSSSIRSQFFTCSAKSGRRVQAFGASVTANPTKTELELAKTSYSRHYLHDSFSFGE